jgi:uncharacterized protein (DUF1015 family)
VWKAAAPDALTEAFRSLAVTYVADGHHRAKSASRVRSELRTAAKSWAAEAPANSFLSVLFPHDELRILPYNRVVTWLPGTPEETLARIGRQCRVRAPAEPAPGRKGSVSLYLAGHWYGLELPAAAGSDPAAALDVSLLQSHVLEPVFGIKDPRTDKHIGFVGGARGTRELERMVDAGEAAAAFSLYPVSIEDLFNIADAGLLMPPKSTWFEPKLRSGLFVHPLG